MRNRSVTHLPNPVFEALADPTRRAVLDLLRHGSRSAGEIARAFPVSRPAISRHLRRLRMAELVSEQRRGRHRLYAINAAPLKEVERWLAEYRVFWEGKLAGLKVFLESDFAAQAKKTRRPS